MLPFSFKFVVRQKGGQSQALKQMFTKHNGAAQQRPHYRPWLKMCWSKGRDAIKVKPMVTLWANNAPSGGRGMGRGVRPTTGGAAPFTRCNPRLRRRADTFFTFIASHTV